MHNGLFRAALLAGALAFTLPAGLQAQEDGDDTGQPSTVGPEVNTETADDTQPAVPTEDTEGCPAGALGTDESAAPSDGTATGTDADLTNCTEKEPTDEPAADGDGDDDSGTEEPGSDDAGTNTGG